MCRGLRGDCDIADYCDGTSNLCADSMFSIMFLPFEIHGYMQSATHKITILGAQLAPMCVTC